MSIVIGCDSFLALRNVQIGNLSRWLADTRIIVWVDPKHLAGSFLAEPQNVALGCLEDFDVRNDRELNRLLLAGSHARKCYYDPATIWADFMHSSHRFNQRKRFRRATSISRAAGRMAGFWLAGAFGLARRWRKDFAAALRNHPVAEIYRQRLRHEGAEVVASFSPEGIREMILIEAANAVGIPTVVMIRSRDNIASKIPFLPFADAYLVWSEVLRDFLLYKYPEIPPDRVYVTGAPQFDHHLDPSYRLKREDVFARIGLDPSRPLILYSMATPTLVPHESAIAQHLADAAHAGLFAHRAQLLVRGHPKTFGSQIKSLQKEYSEARCYPSPTEAEYGGPEHEAQVVRHILEDEPVHLSLLACQDVQVNVCGTMTIDSAIFDKPTVNIYYDLLPGIPDALSVRRHFKRSDTKQMMSYGASRLAHTPAECVELINRYLENPSLDAEGRKRARSEDCGPLDGYAGLRTAQIIQKLRKQPSLASAV